MKESQPIVITGFMGAGKTSVAVALARILNCSSVDLDRATTISNGRTPREIIEQDGEQLFRELETRSLQNVLRASSMRVVALGGGAWTLQINRDLINSHGGITVWLDPPFELCWERTVPTRGERPLATDQERARMLFTERRALYALAQLRVDVTRNKSIDQIAAEIVEALPVQRE